MLPGDGLSVTGVTLRSLPKEATSFYEAPGGSVVFSLPTKAGRVVFVGSKFLEGTPSAAWDEVLYNAAGTTEAEFTQYVRDLAMGKIEEYGSEQSSSAASSPSAASGLQASSTVSTASTASTAPPVGKAA